MIMKRILFLSCFVAMTSMSFAQDDDLYFTPTKKAIKSRVTQIEQPEEQPAYYCGSDRDVDEYNRRGKLKSYYQKIGTDTLGNDIIEFHAGDGTYPEVTDTSYVYPGSAQYDDYEADDFACSRRMGRFDDFYGWYDPFFSSYWYGPYWRSYYGWYSPWYYGGWYDPWYYDSWYGWDWSHPYHYYGWAGWYPTHYYGRPAGFRGTRNHTAGTFDGGRTASFGGRRTTTGASGIKRDASFSNRRSSNVNTNSNRQRRAEFGGQRDNYSTRQYSPSRSNSSFGNSSFGGSRGSFGGGGSSFGGGSRGGSMGGGARFGGRR